eukprot:30392-Pelagococcus_subviridis.AAC.7
MLLVDTKLPCTVRSPKTSVLTVLEPLRPILTNDALVGAMRMSPSFVESPVPLSPASIITSPPLACSEYPPCNTSAPPSPVKLLPAATDTSPPLPPTALPPRISTRPPSPPAAPSALPAIITNSPPTPPWALFPPPDVMNTPPPCFASAPVSPAFITTAPPFSESPEPTRRFTSPPPPDAADPVPNVIPPLSPAHAVPVSTTTPPLTPARPLLSVLTTTSPLDNASLLPLVNTSVRAVGLATREHHRTAHAPRGEPPRDLDCASQAFLGATAHHGEIFCPGHVHGSAQVRPVERRARAQIEVAVARASAQHGLVHGHADVQPGAVVLREIALEVSSRLASVDLNNPASSAGDVFAYPSLHVHAPAWHVPGRGRARGHGHVTSHSYVASIDVEGQVTRPAS